MRSSIRALLAGLAVAALLASAAGAQTTPAPNSLGAPTPSGGSAHPMPEEYMHRWLDYRASMLDARLGGLKAGLRLTPDQEKLWTPFEAAVRNFAEMRTARIQKMIEHATQMGSDEGAPSMAPTLTPLDRLDMMATRMIDVGQSLKGVADTAKPLYASLNEEQKRMFGFLSREMMRMGRGQHGGEAGMWGGDEMGMEPRHHEDLDMGPPPHHAHREEDMESDEDE